LIPELGIESRTRSKTIGSGAGIFSKYIFSERKDWNWRGNSRLTNN